MSNLLQVLMDTKRTRTNLAAEGRSREDANAGRAMQAQMFNTNFLEGQRRYDQDFGEGQRQFDLGFGENQRQFDAGFGENKRQFDVAQALRQQLADFERQFQERDWMHRNPGYQSPQQKASDLAARMKLGYNPNSPMNYFFRGRWQQTPP